MIQTVTHLIEYITDAKWTPTFVDELGKGHGIEDLVHEIVLCPIAIPEELSLTRKKNPKTLTNFQEPERAVYFSLNGSGGREPEGAGPSPLNYLSDRK